MDGELLKTGIKFTGRWRERFRSGQQMGAGGSHLQILATQEAEFAIALSQNDPTQNSWSACLASIRP